jgi:hypothetical protein
MANHQLGDDAKADDAMRDLREIMEELGSSPGWEAVTFFGEAEALVEGVVETLEADEAEE